MPSSSAPVDPEKLGHPVTLTRGEGEGPANEPANGSTTQAPRGVSFAAQESQASEDTTQAQSASTAGGLTSTFDFAQASSSTRESNVKEATTQEKTASSGGGLFSAPDFSQAAEAKEEEVFSPGENVPSAAIDSTQDPKA